jgi:hypothetical protein
MRPTSQPGGLDLLVHGAGESRRPGARRIPLRARGAALVAEFRAAPRRWRQLAAAMAAVVTVLVALGALFEFTGEPGHFQLRGEIQEGFYIPVLVSWAILFTAGLAAGLRALWGLTRIERLAWLGVAGLFVLMAFDELLMIHERVESHTGVDWQLLYLPVFAAGGLAWLLLLLPMRRWSLEQVMWLGAAGLWFVSQIFESLEYTANDVAVDGFRALDGIEKVCQFTGSSLFLLVATLGIARIFYSGRSMNHSVNSAQRPSASNRMT